MRALTPLRRLFNYNYTMFIFLFTQSSESKMVQFCKVARTQSPK
jgi:hypothetical protein